MTFEENPFRVLQVSIYDTKATIIERADDLSFADPDREKIFAQARDTLLNPRKRIAAEVLEIAATNLDYRPNVDVSTVDKKFSAQKPEKILQQLNAARAKSKFPAVQDATEIKSELKNIRYEIREKFQARLKKMTLFERAKFADDLADVIVDRKNFGVIVEDFFDDYRLEMRPLLDEKGEKIVSLLTKLETRADRKFFDELAVAVETFAVVNRPLDKFSAALGSNDFEETKIAFYAVRGAMVDLHNEKDLVDGPLKIFRVLEKNFSYMPPLAEVIRKDVKFLEKEQARRPTQSFLNAKDAFDKVQAALDRNLHFKAGFEQSNLDFYLKVFKPTYDGMIAKLMTGKHPRKPKEWVALSAQAAVIYLRMGTAMTWTNFHPKTTLELFRKALIHANNSGDAELISLARKRVDEWSEFNEQIYGNSRSSNSSSSSGCLSVIAAVAIICLLMF